MTPHPLSTQPLRGAIIGYGNMGRQFHALLASPSSPHDARIIAACDPVPPADSPDVPFYSNFALLLERERPDFVILASPTAVHAEQVALAARYHCHVLCEKPLALSLADADTAIRAAAAAGITTVVNYSLRFIPAYRALQELIISGALGRLLSISHTRTRGFGLHASGARHAAIEHPDVSGGWTVHHACHGIDLLLWLGGPFSRVTALTATTAPGEGAREELVHGLVQFANGAVGHVFDSVCALREHHTLVVGSAASAVLTGEHQQTRLRVRVEGSVKDLELPTRDTKDHNALFTHFFHCIRTGEASPHSLAAARPSLAAALRFQESARLGQCLSLP